MAKFDAGLEVEKLTYDFTAYGGKAGDITEPSTKAVNQYFQRMKALAKEFKGLRAMADVDIEELGDEELAEVLGKVDEASEGAVRLQEAQVANLALLCGAEQDEEGNVIGGSPSFDELQKLPYRVLQSFNQWMVQQIQPKKTTPGSKR